MANTLKGMNEQQQEQKQDALSASRSAAGGASCSATDGDGRALTSAKNGRKGVGPVSAAGRAVAAQNATRHGIISREAVIAKLGEREGEWAAIRDALWAELAPVGVVETMLADLILSSYWRLRRVVVAEGGMIVQRALTVARERGAASASGLAAFDAAQLPTSKDVERIVRYQSLLTRELFRAIDRLVAAQERRMTNDE